MRHPMALRAVQDTSIPFILLSSNPGPLRCVRRGFSPEKRVNTHKKSSQMCFTYMFQANKRWGIKQGGAPNTAEQSDSQLRKVKSVVTAVVDSGATSRNWKGWLLPSETDAPAQSPYTPCPERGPDYKSLIDNWQTPSKEGSQGGRTSLGFTLIFRPL
jgi:hypothetical protein